MRPTRKSDGDLRSRIWRISTGEDWLWGRKIKVFSASSTYRTTQLSFFRTAYRFNSPLRYGLSEV